MNVDSSRKNFHQIALLFKTFMTNLSIYLESPEWMPLARSITFESIIIDMPFCSVRPFKPFDWTPELIQTMKDSLSCQYFILNIDGLYSDTELAIIENTIRTLSLDCIFDGFRFQDPGLIQWSSNRFPSQIIQLNMETGAQNHISIQHWLIKVSILLYLIMIRHIQHLKYSHP